MKKILGIFVAVLLVAGLAGYASADLTADQELVRVVYNTTFNGSSGQPQVGTGTFDVITDLGNINTDLSTVAASGPLTLGGGANAYTNSFSENTGFSGKIANLMVAYFVIDFGSAQAYVASSSTTPLHSGGNAWNGMNGVQVTTLDLAQYGSGLAGTGGLEPGSSTSVLSQSNAQSYQSYMEAGGAGAYVGFIVNGGNSFLTESKLASVGSGSIVQYLDFFSNANIDQTGALVKEGGNNIEILTNADGSTTLEEAPATVPVPPSLLLLAPGLLGMIGIRRRLW